MEPEPFKHSDLPREIDAISHSIIGCAFEVHRCLGPGMLERLYEQALAYELRQAGLGVDEQVEIRVPYKGILLEPQRIDLIVGRSVIVELKSIRAIEDVHKAQLLSYLRMANLPLGLLINFNVSVLKDGIRRVLNERSPLVSSSRLRDLRVQPDSN